MSGSTHDALRSYVDKWLVVQPYQRAALPFVDPQRYPGHIALAALEQEWLSASYGIREPQVAATKLNWWAEELAGAGTSGGRHPLTQVLFGDPRAGDIDASVWLAPVLAALEQLEQGTAASFDEQLTAAAPLHGALARLETLWWFGPDAAAEKAVRVATLAHLLHALRRLQDDAERDRLPLPMSQLARFGLARGQLRQPSEARDQAVRAQLDDLRQAWFEAVRLPGPLSVFRALESRHDQQLARRARAASEALPILQREQIRVGFSATFGAWNAARRWQLATRS